MPLLVRTWNVFHGNTSPPERRGFLEEMVRLATADDPDVVCLQEVPVWALSRLESWSGMHARGAVAARPAVGPLPSSAELGRALTVHHGRLRSAFTGQANAILVARRHRVDAGPQIVLNPLSFRRSQARRLGLDLLTRLAWAKERRVCHAVRVGTREGTTLVVANLHATPMRPDERVTDAELRRAATFADALAAPTEPLLFCGDFNLEAARSRTLHDLSGPEWGFSAPAPWIDQVLVRGTEATAVETWPPARRSVDGRVLSDHAPVEVRVA